MKRIDSEFAFQARELAAQIEDTLGDPPNRKNYRMVVDALVAEFTKGAFVEDVNFLSLALVDHLRFNNLPSLLASAKQYESGNSAEIIDMVSAEGACATMLAAIFKTHPDLTRQAIIVAFLHKNPKLWLHEEHAASAEDKDENDDDTDSENDGPSSDVVGLFDEVGD
ncbi:MAG: hypothetical protein ABL902_03745 [Gallionella sp.]|nr:hypothetical protein [Gallionella sp.]